MNRFVSHYRMDVCQQTEVHWSEFVLLVFVAECQQFE
jgi:hypothetical protein